MTQEQATQAAILAILQMSDADKAAFIAMFEAGQNDMCQDAAKGFALRGIHNQQILASKAMDNISALTAIIEDMI